jgi:Spy/CpxP family protein refolding chaperone
MPEGTAVAEPPVETKPQVAPVAPEKWGNKFRDEFAKLKTAESQVEAPVEPEKKEAPIEPQKEAPKEATPATPPQADVKPTSPLEAVLAEEKPTTTEPSKEDPLAQFEKVEKPSSDNWKAARETMKRQSEELKTLKSAPKPDTAAIEALTKERDDFKARVEAQEQNLKAVNAEYSDEYQSLVRDRGKTLGKIAKHLKYSGAENAEVLLDALNLPDGKFKTDQVKAILSGFDETDRTTVVAHIKDLEEADEKIIDFRKDLPGQFDRLQSKQQAKQAEEAVQNIKNLEVNFDKVVQDLPKLVKTLREVPDDIDGAEEWNKPIREARQRALQALKPGGADFNQTVAIAVKGELYDNLEQRYIAAHKELSEAKARLKEFDGASPDFKGGKSPTTQAAKKPGQVFRDTMAKLQTSDSDV